MNQLSAANMKNSVEKDFSKFLNNASFGYDCRNDFGNCTFKPISD